MDAERLLTWFGKKSRQPTQKTATVARPASPTQFLPKHYLVLNEIGAGGMGVLYKAIDTRLHRPVVVKAIRESLLQDADLVQRFRKEALANAAIDHPYVCKIYELLETEGRTLLVLEYVEGENLEQVLAKGPLSLTETLRFSTEIAEALSAAHERGLVHRDIKPSNIIITAHRHVKVIDFGLAKALQEREEPLSQRTEDDGKGSFVGTLSYMSPEQASGGEIGLRSDVFSLGVLIFQCLSGHLPFQGESMREYVQSLLLDAPKPLRSLVPSAPAELERLVERCLSKQPEGRFESADALAKALVEIGELISSSSVAGQLVPVLPRRRVQSRAAWVGMAAVLGVAGFLGVNQWLQSRKSISESGRYRAESVVTWPSEELASRLSPDGKWISFISNRDGYYNLWLQKVTGGEPFVITKSASRIQTAIWSPDSREMAHCQLRDKEQVLSIIPATGGSARREFRLKLSSPDLLHWLGSHLYIQSRDSLWVLDVGSGELRKLFEANAGTSIRTFDVSRDEMRILYAARQEGQFDLWMLPLSGGEVVRLTESVEEERFPRWLNANGTRLVFSRAKGGEAHLWSLDLESGQQRQMTFGSGGRERIDDVSQDGRTLTYVKVEESSNLHQLDTQTMTEVQLTADTLQDYWPSVSSETGQVSFQRSNSASEMEDFFTETRIFLGSGKPAEFQYARLKQEQSYGPSLSPDGRWLVFMKTRLENGPAQTLFRPDLWVLDLQTQQPRPLAQYFELGPYYPFPLQRIFRNLEWSSDSRVLYSVHRTVEGSELRRFRIENGNWASEVLLTAQDKSEMFWDPVLSADGRFLAYASSNSGPAPLFRVLVLELDSGKPPAVIFEQEQKAFTDVLVRGWTQQQELLIIGCEPNEDDLTARISIFTVHPVTGVRSVLGEGREVYGGTARFDRLGQTLYVTAVEGQAHNLFAFSLKTRLWRRLTRNEFPGVTYSGIEIRPQGELLYSRQTWNKNIWRLDYVDEPPQ